MKIDNKLKRHLANANKLVLPGGGGKVHRVLHYSLYYRLDVVVAGYRHTANMLMSS